MLMPQGGCRSVSIGPLLGLIAQIISAIVILEKSKDENPRVPLDKWAIGYASACGASIILSVYWQWAASPISQDEEMNVLLSTFRENQRLGFVMENLKRLLDTFFLVWFTIGNVWIFGGNSSPKETPNLYWLCFSFLVISFVGYAFLFITLVCCMPFICALIGYEIGCWGQTDAAARRAQIKALPRYKFKAKESVRGEDLNPEGSVEAGFIAFGTDKQRAVSVDDAVCSICLGKYKNRADLRELPCTHLYHTKCIDAWLKISVYCPLCRRQVWN